MAVATAGLAAASAVIPGPPSGLSSGWASLLILLAICFSCLLQSLFEKGGRDEKGFGTTQNNRRLDLCLILAILDFMLQFY